MTHAAPLVRGQVMIAANGRASGVEVIGERLADLQTVPLVEHPETAAGDLGAARRRRRHRQRAWRATSGSGVGDVVSLISPQGMDTPFGTQPRVNDYPVVYVFGVGRYDIDKTRVYLPFAEAQSFFDREGAADEIEVMVTGPRPASRRSRPALAAAAGPRALLWTWRDASGAFLSALDTERRVMFIILSHGGADRGAQHHLRAGDAGEEQGPRHRHPAHRRADPGLDHAGLLPLRLADRGGRHAARA